MAEVSPYDLDVLVPGHFAGLAAWRGVRPVEMCAVKALPSWDEKLSVVNMAGAVSRRGGKI